MQHCRRFVSYDTSSKVRRPKTNFSLWFFILLTIATIVIQACTNFSRLKDRGTNLYEVLGIERDATQAEIKAAYEKKKTEHIAGDEVPEDATESFKLVFYAYTILSNEELRKMYDEGGLDAVENEGYVMKPKGLLDFCKHREPWSLSKIRPLFKVYARNKKRLKRVIRDESEVPAFVQKLRQDGYLNESRPIIFVTHGYMGRVPFYLWPFQIKDNLLEKEDATVLVVEWGRGAHVLYSYRISLYNTQTISDIIVVLATAIYRSDLFKGNRNLIYLHCIGHSLGAHVCGQAGRKAKIFDRVSGLDPAGPGFEECVNNVQLRVGVDSAECVDNIHTDGLKRGRWFTWLVPYLGTLESWGHVDFYPNNGGHQPGCRRNIFVPWCSHLRATDLFVESVKQDPSTFKAKEKCEHGDEKCKKKEQPMGYYSSCYDAKKNRKKIVPGRFYMTTEVGKG